MNHYAFHIMDRDWGHLIIRFCPHPPFNALVILNGHEWVARQARQQGVSFRKEGNCFTELSNARDLGRIAEALSSSDASSVGRLAQAPERWISPLDQRYRGVDREIRSLFATVRLAA